MKTIKRVAVLLLACALMLTAVACHQPNETVMTIGDVAIPSGLYLAMQMDSFSEFTTNVQSTLTSDQTMSTIEEALSYSYEDKSSDEWIKEQTLEAAKKYAAVLSLFNEFGLEITAEEEDNLAQWVDYYWSEDYQNMQSYYEPNGISKQSFAELMRSGTRETKVFLHYYDKDGIEPVADADVLQGFKDNYALVDVLPISKTTTDSSGNSASLSDDELAAAKSKLEGYAQRINNGKATFEGIYKEYNLELDEDFTMPEITEEMSQKYPYAMALSSTDSDTTNYELFSSLKEKDSFDYGKAYVVEDSSYYYLGILRDITTDEFYTEDDTYRQNILYALKTDEFEQKLTEKAGSMTLDKNDSLIRYYSPKKIVNG